MITAETVGGCRNPTRVIILRILTEGWVIARLTIPTAVFRTIQDTPIIVGLYVCIIHHRSDDSGDAQLCRSQSYAISDITDV